MEIELFYKPTAYITFRTAVQVYFPLLMSTPLCFYVSAHTKPGYERYNINYCKTEIVTNTEIPKT